MKRLAIVIPVLLLTLVGCIGSIEPEAARVASVQSIKPEAPEPGKTMTQSELQAELMNYADSFAQLFGGSCNQVERAVQDPQLRLLCKQAKVFSISSVISIAAGPSPEAALLDMLVVVTLNRLVWEEHARSNRFGDQVAGVRETVTGLEQDLWQIAGRVLSPQAQEEIRHLVQDWWESHPDVSGVNFLRFGEFSGSLRGRDAREGGSSGGILAQVSRVTQQVDASLLLAERGMYLLSRLQLLASLQVDLAYMNILNEPETSRLLNDINALVRFSQTLPATVTRERTEALNQLIAGVAKERNEALNQLIDGIARERSAAIEQALGKVAEERQASIEQLMEAFATERSSAIEQAATTLNSESSELIRRLIESQDHAFRLGIIFLVATLAGTVVAALVYRYLRYRLIDVKSVSKN